MESGSIHCHVSNLSRQRASGGQRSALAHAAYISGTALFDPVQNRVQDYHNRRDVWWSDIVLPNGCPSAFADRQVLWRTVEHSLKRKDARLAKKIEVAITRSIPQAGWPELAQQYAATFTDMGMIADVAIHYDAKRNNPHLHLMLTVNKVSDAPYKPEGFGAKLPGVDSKAFVVTTRTRWADLQNAALAAAGVCLRVDARSYKTRGIAKTPTRHRGPHAEQLRAPPHSNQEHSMAKKEPVPPVPSQQSLRPWYDIAAERAARDYQLHAAPAPQTLSVDHLQQERDYLDRAAAMPEHPSETALRESVASATPAIQERVEAEILASRLDRLRQQDRLALQEQLAHELTPDAHAKLERLMQDAEPRGPVPEPGPDGELYARSELAKAWERQRDEYER